MSELVEEVSRRASSDYVKGKAKDMARQRARVAMEKVSDNSWVLTLLGGGLGALLGRSLASRVSDRYGHPTYRYSGNGQEERGYPRFREESYGVPYDEAHAIAQPGVEEHHVGSEGGGIKEKAGEVKEKFSEKAGELKERISGKTGEMRERFSHTGSELKERAGYAAGRVRERIPSRQDLAVSAREQPILWAIGALVFGAVFGLLVPLTGKERQVLVPAKEKAKELGEETLEKAKAFGRGFQEGIGEQQGQPAGRPGELTGAPTVEPGPAPIGGELPGEYTH